MPKLLFPLILLIGTSNLYGLTVSKIKSLFKEVERNRVHYRIDRSHFETDYGGEDKTVYIDRNGVVRKLVVEGGSEDSYHKGEYYYTRNGTLFFSYLEDSNVGGCTTERRYYISEHRIIKHLKKIKRCSLPHAYPIKIYKPKAYFRR